MVFIEPDEWITDRLRESDVVEDLKEILERFVDIARRRYDEIKTAQVVRDGVNDEPYKGEAEIVETLGYMLH